MYQIFKGCDSSILWSIAFGPHKLFLHPYWGQFGNFKFKFILLGKIRSEQKKRFIIVTITIRMLQAVPRQLEKGEIQAHTAILPQYNTVTGEESTATAGLVIMCSTEALGGFLLGLYVGLHVGLLLVAERKCEEHLSVHVMLTALFLWLTLSFVKTVVLYKLMGYLAIRLAEFCRNNY